MLFDVYKIYYNAIQERAIYYKIGREGGLIKLKLTLKIPTLQSKNPHPPNEKIL